MGSMQTAAETAVRQCVGLKAEESCLVVTDEGCKPVGEALFDVAATISDDTVLLRLLPPGEHGEEPPAPVAAAMQAADVFLAPTSKSLSHTRARSRACEAGARGATLPGITEEVFTTGMDADYERIGDECQRVASALAGARTVRVRTDRGTDIRFEVADRSWKQDTGMVHEAGAFSNLPAGEVFVSPASASGTYVVDGSIRPHGLLEPDQTVTVRVEDGYAVDISDPGVAKAFERAAETVGRDAYNVAELGIGTNVGVTELVGSILLDEKAGGTVHIALGDDASIGGETEAPIHCDGVIRNPVVEVDGEVLSLPNGPA